MTTPNKPTMRERPMPDPARYIPGAVCPACEKAWLKPEEAHNSRSRYAEAYICSPCGAREAFNGFFWKDNCLKRGIALNEAGQTVVYGRATP